MVEAPEGDRHGDHTSYGTLDAGAVKHAKRAGESRPWVWRIDSDAGALRQAGTGADAAKLGEVYEGAHV